MKALQRPRSVRRPLPLRFAFAMALCAAVLLAGEATAEDQGGYEESTSSAEGLPAWSDGVLDTWSLMPVQDQGRVKPLATLARYTLLPINGRSSVKLGDDKRTAMAWMLDALFHPEKVAGYPFFQIQDSSVLEAAGDKALYKTKRKRDRYSYRELAPLEASITRLGEDWSKEAERVGRKNLTTVQAQTIDLWQNLLLYKRVTESLDWARTRFDLSKYPHFKTLVAGRDTARVSEIIRNLPQMYVEYFRRLRTERESGQKGDGPGGSDAIQAEIEGLYGDDVWPVLSKPGLALFPPAMSAEKQPAWFGPQDFRVYIQAGADPAPSRMIAMLATFEDLVDSSGNMAQFDLASEELLAQSKELAVEREEYGGIELEVFYYGFSPFHWALGWFILGFLIVAISWLKPGMRFVTPLAWILVSAGLAFCVFGITLRCIIRERPPVSTLYETILFITACSVLTCLVVEWINRKRLALALGAVLGAAGMFLSWMYDEFDAKDTMPQLQAVLDTNFWLATHVTCITLGYAAGLLASAIGHVYVLGKAFGLKLADAGFYRTVGRMTYGTLAFCLIFSVVGTILGGIWANDSWGRFWGWDPKENGALMICLWTLAILHARMGGYIKAFGIAQAAIFGGIIVGWSWWGVNLLGAGLHSYGFTEGVARVLYTCMLIEAAVIATGLVWWLVYGRTGRADAAARAAAANLGTTETPSEGEPA